MILWVPGLLTVAVAAAALYMLKNTGGGIRIITLDAQFKKNAVNIFHERPSRSNVVLEFKLVQHSYSQSESFVYDLLQTDNSSMPNLVILPKLFQSRDDPQIQAICGAFVEQKLVRNIVIVYERGTCQALPAGHQLRNHYTNVRDVCTVVAGMDGGSIVLGFHEASIKVLNCFYNIDAEARIRGYITINPVLDPIDYMFERTDPHTSALLKQYLVFNREFVAREIVADEEGCHLFREFWADPSRQNFDALFCRHFGLASPEKMYTEALGTYNIPDLCEINWLTIGPVRMEYRQLISKHCQKAAIVSGAGISNEQLAELAAAFVQRTVQTAK